MTKLEIDMLIGILNSMINYAITVRPELKDNKVIKDIEMVITGLKAIGL